MIEYTTQEASLIPYKDRIPEKQKDCGSCEWWYDGHCLSYDSEYSGKPRKLKDSCERWEEKDV